MTALSERPLIPVNRAGQFTALVAVSRPAVRGALVRRLHSLGAREIFETTSLAGARSQSLTIDPGDLVIADSTLIDGSGVALVTELRRAGWPRGVVLGPSDDASSVRTALAAGIHGYVVTHPERIQARPLSGNVTIITPQTSDPIGPDGLSDRELEVLHLVAEGQGHREGELPSVLHAADLDRREHVLVRPALPEAPPAVVVRPPQGGVLG